jgi:hypothetical protein
MARFCVEKSIEDRLALADDLTSKNNAPLGYVNKGKPVRELYIRLYLIAALVVFFLCNMVIAILGFSSIPESSYHMTTMSGELHEMKPREIINSKELDALIREHYKQPERK